MSPGPAEPTNDRVGRTTLAALASAAAGAVVYVSAVTSAGPAWELPDAVAAVACVLASGALLYRGRPDTAANVAGWGMLAITLAACAQAGGPSSFPPLLSNTLIALAMLAPVSTRWTLVGQTVLAALLVGSLWWLEGLGELGPEPPGFHRKGMVYATTITLVGGGLLILVTDLVRATMQDHARDQQRFRHILDQMPDGLVSLDRDGFVVSCNPAAAAIAGRPVEQILGRHFTSILRHEDEASTVREVRSLMDGGVPTLSRRVVRRLDGSEVIVEAHTSVVTTERGPELRLVMRDLTERVRHERHQSELERQLLDARHMEAVGRLAGGVAHDFNNLLTVILSSASLLKDEPVSEDASSLLDELTTAAERAADLTGQLLAFARRQVREPKVVDLSGVVRRAQPLLRRLVREDIQLSVVTEEVLPIYADPVQIEQVLVNLVVNARDALPSGGSLTLETQAAELGADYALGKAGVQPGRYALLAVTDTGAGMDADTASHVFEPFFSTKGSRGTGLGLATVHGIVKQSGGHVFVYSEVGRGTTFKVYLPITERPLVEEAREATPAPEPDRQGTVLVVDDDAAVLATTARVLKAAGYEVLVAHGPEEALALSQMHRGAVDLLVTDVVMPKIGGADLAERLTVARPGLKVLFASGYTENSIVHHGVLEPGIHFIAKPFTPAQLRARVDQVLGRRER